MFAAALGFALGLVLTFGLDPLLVQLDMRMSVSGAMAALVFVATQVLCLSASIVSFRKVRSLDPAIVFRG